MQEAWEIALRRWPVDGTPDNPGAWITTTARNQALDRLRRARVGASKLEAVGRAAVDGPGETPVEAGELPDDRLRLFFTCCHPALAIESRVALTLRLLGGLSTGEIARAFLVSEAAMARRLTRAKVKIRDAGIPYEVPRAAQLPERLDGVLTCLYLVFNEGYGASAGDTFVRSDLCAEAIRLARILSALLPREPEPAALLALLLLTDARRPARLDADGEIVLLEDQDRGRWDAALIAEGRRQLARAVRLGGEGRYVLQAAIAAEHARATEADATDWRRIAALYAALAALDRSPVVLLNMAVAVAMVDGPAAGLALADGVATELDGYHLLHATRAELLRRAERPQEAREALERALALAPHDAERRLLERRLEALG